MDFIWIVAIAVIFFVIWLMVSQDQENKRLEIVAAEAKAEKEARQAELEAELLIWVEQLQTEGWSYLSLGKMMHIPGQPRCVMGLSTSAPLLRFNQFETEEELTIHEPILLSLNDVLSLNVARPTVRQTRKEVVPVPITENHRRSPVARGLIGGAILGPAGLVLGAASGLNSKTATTMKYETVVKEFDGLGSPQLIIGTKREDYPYFKIQCANQEVADEWMYRIRGRQSRGSS